MYGLRDVNCSCNREPVPCQLGSLAGPIIPASRHVASFVYYMRMAIHPWTCCNELNGTIVAAGKSSRHDIFVSYPVTGAVLMFSEFSVPVGS